MPVRPRSLVSEVKGMARGGERARLRGCGDTATCGCNTGAMAGLLGALLVASHCPSGSSLTAAATAVCFYALAGLCRQHRCAVCMQGACVCWLHALRVVW